MKVETYAFGIISFLSFLTMVLAIVFCLIGVCSIAPCVLAFLIFAVAFLFLLKSLPKDRTRQKKAKKSKKEKVAVEVGK